jgi:hypothetical protein
MQCGGSTIYDRVSVCDVMVGGYFVSHNKTQGRWVVDNGIWCSKHLL